MTDSPDSTVTYPAVVCESCGSDYEISPTNCVSPKQFVYCPNCGEELPGDRITVVEDDW